MISIYIASAWMWNLDKCRNLKADDIFVNRQDHCNMCKIYAIFANHYIIILGYIIIYFSDHYAMEGLISVLLISWS